MEVQSCECWAPYLEPTDTRSTSGILQHAGRHGLPFGHLVEDFVAGAAHEVTIHQFGHDTATAHGIANSRRRRLRLQKWTY